MSAPMFAPRKGSQRHDAFPWLRRVQGVDHRDVIIQGMSRLMRISCWAVLIVAASFWSHAAETPQLQNVGRVYLWPMSNAFDQYLAQQITAEGLFEIVVDPKLAGTIMTEKIDNTFLQALDELFPPEDSAIKKEKTAEKTKSGDSLESDFRMRRPGNHPKAAPRGTLFLVDLASRKVIWSTYLKEFDADPNGLHKQARTVVEKLKGQMKPGS